MFCGAEKNCLRDGSFKYQQNMFWMQNKINFDNRLLSRGLIITHIIWALTRDNLSLGHVINKGADQLAHTHIPFSERIISQLVTSKILLSS